MGNMYFTTISDSKASTLPFRTDHLQRESLGRHRGHKRVWALREDGACWPGMPARQYTKADGEVAYSRIVDFVDKEAQQRFQKAAVDRFFGAGEGDAGKEALF